MVCYPVVLLRVMIATALVMLRNLSLNDHWLPFVVAKYFAAVDAVKCMSTNGLALHQNVATLALAATLSVKVLRLAAFRLAALHLAVLHLVDVPRAGQFAVGSQEISCVDSGNYWVEDAALVHSLQ